MLDGDLGDEVAARPQFDEWMRHVLALSRTFRRRRLAPRVACQSHAGGRSRAGDPDDGAETPLPVDGAGRSEDDDLLALAIVAHAFPCQSAFPFPFPFPFPNPRRCFARPNAILLSFVGAPLHAHAGRDGSGPSIGRRPAGRDRTRPDEPSRPAGFALRRAVSLRCSVKVTLTYTALQAVGRTFSENEGDWPCSASWRSGNSERRAARAGNDQSQAGQSRPRAAPRLHAPRHTRRRFPAQQPTAGGQCGRGSPDPLPHRWRLGRRAITKLLCRTQSKSAVERGAVVRPLHRTGWKICAEVIS